MEAKIMCLEIQDASKSRIDAHGRIGEIVRVKVKMRTVRDECECPLFCRVASEADGLINNSHDFYFHLRGR